MGFLSGSVVKNPSAMQETQETRFNPWVWKVPWRKAWQPSPVFLPREFHGQRYWRLRSTESDTTELTKPSPTQMTLQLLTSLKKDTEWPLMAEEFTGPGSRKAQECILRIDSFTDRRPRREAGKMEASTNKCHFLKLNVILQKQSFIYSTYSFIRSARLHCLYRACLSLCCWRQRPWPSTHSGAR